MNNSSKNARLIPGTRLDKGGHPYYFEPKTRTAYFIADRDLKLAEVLAYRVYIAVSLSVVLYSLLQGSVIYYVGLGVSFYALLEWTYRRSILKRCKKISPYVSERDQRDSMMHGQKRSMLLLKTSGYLVAAILLVISILESKNEGLTLAILIAMIGLCVIGAIQNIRLLMSQRH